MAAGSRRLGGFLTLALAVLVLFPEAGCKKADDYYVYDQGGTGGGGGGGGGKSKSRRGEPDMMFGRVVDRNDKPLSGVTVRISPGTVTRVSSKWGEYEIEYLYTEDGERLALKKNQDYTISAWKAGYHETTQIFRYDGGSSEIPTITLVEDTITLSPSDSLLDPDTINQDPPVDSQGQSYEN